MLAATTDPTLDAIASVTISEDAPLQTVALTGIAAGAAGVQPLRVTAISSDEALIPTPTVDYTSPATTGGLTFAPIPNASGSTTITVTVEDGGQDGNLDTTQDNAAVIRTFHVTVTPVNDQPTLDELPNVSLDEDAPERTVLLSGISAGGGESQPLRITTTTSDRALIPPPTVAYATPSGLGTLAFKPSPNASGSATITVTVEDGGQDGNFATTEDNANVTRTLLVTVSPIDDKPTLDELANVSLDEDASEQTVLLSGISAGGGEVQPLRVTASSSNEALIPSPAVTYTSPSTTGSLAFTPTPNASGSTTITVTVTDGGWDGDFDTPHDNQITSKTFHVTINRVNDAPTLDALANVSLQEDAPENTVFLGGITAGGGEAQPLRVTASSSNEALIPSPSVNYASPSTTGSLAFTPSPNASGSAAITVTVEDGGLDGNFATADDNSTVSRTFEVTVSPINDKPSLDELANISLNEDASEQTLLLSGISAGGGEAQPLRVTASSSNQALIPSPSVNYTSPNTTGSLAFTPTPNASGSTTITVTVTDGGWDGDFDTLNDNASFTRTFEVTVNPVNDQPTLDELPIISLAEDAPEHTVLLSEISAGGGEAQPLRVTASSSNQALIPSPSVNYTSPNTTGSLAFTPTPNASGSATITVTVEDGGLDGAIATAEDNAFATQTFTVTVSSRHASLMTLTSDGRWLLAKSNGSQFDVSVFSVWATSVTWTSILQGDVNGDGLVDVIGRTHIGQWWATINNGDGTGSNIFMGYWKADMGFSDIVSGDFNGDGRADVAGRTSSGQWWIGASRTTSPGFSNIRMARWSAGYRGVAVQTGDFNGDGLDDIAGLSDTGQWWGVIGSATGVGTAAFLGTWSPSLGLQDIVSGDFNGDGRTDVAGRAASGQWWVAVANPTSPTFENTVIGGWSTTTVWKNVAAGDFNRDGVADIIGRAENGQWWGLLSDPSGGLRANTLVSYWSRSVTWSSIVTGDANSDGRTDIIGRVAPSAASARGRLWVGLVGDSASGLMSTEAWGFFGVSDNVEARTTFVSRF